ncbi:c-Myc-binding protein homolog [Anabrus simplex]|uniref:c-Myc-binding protein homolog n=1 Tax=Anabrus simplex TaxID=316456 RepID=UPI0034DD534A
MAANYRPIDSKREEFRKYLERAGVMDALTKALVSLYEETDKPADALDYVRKCLGDNRPDEAEFQATKNELAEALATIEQLKAEIALLQEQLVAQPRDEVPPDAPPEGELQAAEEPPPEAEPEGGEEPPVESAE